MENAFFFDPVKAFNPGGGSAGQPSSRIERNFNGG
jgi:hypothetical protein